MILVVSNSKDETTNYLVNKIHESSMAWVRIDTDTCLKKVETTFRNLIPGINIEGSRYSPSDINHVWYRRPKPISNEKTNDEDELHRILEYSEALECFFSFIPINKWMNHPSNNAKASHKSEQLARAKEMGFRIPDTIITQDEKEAMSFYKKYKGKIIVKPIASGYIERKSPNIDSQIYTSSVNSDDLKDLYRLKYCPTLFQHKITKAFDVRICIIDEYVKGVKLLRSENGNQILDIRRDNMDSVEYESVGIPGDIMKMILNFVKSYQLRFSAIDMVVDTTGQWYFLENNPNGQWAWLDLVANQNMFEHFLESFK